MIWIDTFIFYKKKTLGRAPSRPPPEKQGFLHNKNRRSLALFLTNGPGYNPTSNCLRPVPEVIQDN